MAFWKQRLYADAAAGTPLSARAKGELMRLLELYGNAGGLHREAVAAKAEVENARATVARTIGAHADEIIFTGSGTEANNLALQGVLRPLLLQDGVNVITTAIEHPSVLEPLRALQKEGLALIELPVSREGLVDPEEIAEHIDENTALISVQLVNSEIGTIEPIREIAKVIRKKNNKIYFHVDASQAPLWMDIKVEKLGVDLLTLDAQKISGPKGVGALFAKRGSDLQPLIWGGGQEGGFRSGTENTPLIGSFAAALEEAQTKPAERAARTAEVREYCWEQIQKLLPDALMNGARGTSRIANNLNVSIPGLEAQMAVIALDAEGIAAATRSACGTGSEEPSHVIQALGLPPDLAGTAVRITFLPGASKRDALRIARTLAEIAQRYKKVV